MKLSRSLVRCSPRLWTLCGKRPATRPATNHRTDSDRSKQRSHERRAGALGWRCSLPAGRRAPQPEEVVYSESESALVDADGNSVTGW